jgi:ribosomal protein L16/L10AE
VLQLLAKRKFKHQHKGRLRGALRKGSTVRFPFSFFIFKSRETALVTFNQLEVVRRGLRRVTRRFAKSSRQHDLLSRLCFSVFSPRTKKKRSARMGCAKGPFRRFVYPMRAGQSFSVSREQRKLPLRGFSYCRAILKRMPSRGLIFCRKPCVTYH